MITKNSAVVAIYKSHAEAVPAVKILQQSGFDMENLSIVGRDYHTDESVDCYSVPGDRMKDMVNLGAFSDGSGGLLFDSAFIVIPGIGPLLMEGPIVGWVVAGQEVAAVMGGFSALGVGLYSIGIPKDSVVQYETAAKSGKCILIVLGYPAEIHQAKQIINSAHPEALEEHQPVRATA